MNAYGYSPDEWARAKQQAKAAMIDAIRGRGTIAYSDLVGRISAIQLEPRDIRLDSLLGEISTEEDAAGRGMLSVVVVHKTGDYQPGPGFFELADRLGRDTTDQMKFWTEEFARVQAQWTR